MRRLNRTLEIRVLALCVHAGEWQDFYFTASEKHVQFSCPALEMISNANSAAV